jgi:hypothetical protein
MIKTKLTTCVLGLTLGTLIGCAGEPTIQTGEDAETVMGNLNRVDNSRAQLAYVDPAADYSRYSKVQVQPLDLDNVEIIQPSTASSISNRYNREWELTDGDREKLQAAFREVMEAELTKNGDFSLSETGGDDVITLSAMLTQIAPNAPKDDIASRGSARTRVYSDGSGSISIAIAFADGDSGEVLALIKDRRRGNNNTWTVNNAVTNMADVRRTFRTWAMQIHDGLMALRARGNGAAADL